MAVTLREFFVSNPDVAEQFSSKNDVSVLDRTVGSNMKAWWWCDKYGCEYEKVISSKVKNPGSCSVCNGSLVFPGFNDLGTVRPDIAGEWDVEKNGGVLPSEVKFSSGRKFWFRCSVCGFSFCTALSHRTSSGSGCPQCAHRRRLKDKGYVLVSEVGGAMSAMFRGGADMVISSDSFTVVDWECGVGHVWRQAPRDFVGCPLCGGDRLVVGSPGGDVVVFKPAGVTVADYPLLLERFGEGNVFDPSFLSASSARVVQWVCDKGHVWDASVYSMKRSVDSGLSGCPHCSTMASRGERELAGFIRSVLPHDVDVLTSDRSLITPKELDVYIPGLNIAVEFNGLYWHDDSHVPNGEHARKLKLCAERGVQLITVWEDDWLYRRSVVESMLKHKLGVSDRRTVYARQTSLRALGTSEARVFCDMNHIQGFVQGTLYLGLYDTQNNLVAVSVWRKNKNILYLERYCTSVVIPGGMGKLLKYAKVWATEQGFEKIVTFSDHAVSDGGLYSALGFVHNGELKPDYMYVVNKKRVHKFNYRKKRFRQDPNLQYKDGLSESELATLNNIPKIYDCGKTRWVIDV